MESEEFVSPKERLILVVDDDPEMLALYQAYLAPEGFHIATTYGFFFPCTAPICESFAACASKWNGCGSQSRAKATISCAVTGRSPNSTTSPTGKSS